MGALKMPPSIVAWRDWHDGRLQHHWTDRVAQTPPEFMETGDIYVRADTIPQWRPIEDAPEGGSILGWRSGWKGPDVVVWDETWRCWYNSECEYRVNPSHWQPLPTPPDA